MELAKAYNQLLQRVQAACKRVGRNTSDIRLVAVSKTVGTDIIRQAYELGIRDFGENRAQDLRDKAGLLPGDINWHFIGHLQTNKIKYVAPKAVLIHSLDSWELACAISDYCEKHNLTVQALLQVNASGEVSKYGVPVDRAEKIFLRIYKELPNIRLRGLMTMAPLTEDESVIRQTFRKLKQLQEKLETRIPIGSLDILSMGMTHDFEIAIEEGSTMIRVGTALFGTRRR